MKEVFENLLTDLVNQKVLSESKKDDLLKVFESKLKEIKESEFKKASELSKQKFKKYLKKVDENHCKIFKRAMQLIDEEHSRLFKKALKKIDKDCSEKLLKVVKKLRDKNINENLVEKISDYFDTYIKESIPKATVVDKAKLDRLEKLYEDLRKMLFITDDYVQKEIKEAVEDAAKIISEKESEIDKLMLEKIELNKKIKKIEADRFLESKTKDMSPKMKAYIESFFKNADIEEIESKINEAISAFKKSEEEERNKLISEAEKKKKIVKPIISEEQDLEELNKEPNEMDIYAKMISKSIKSNKWVKNNN